MFKAAERTRRGTILVVEDRDDVRGALLELLELNGYCVADARDGVDALRQLTAEPEAYSLILLDLALPGDVNGTDLRRRQLDDAALANIPTIVITACDVSPEDRQPLRPAAWLDKPYHVPDLLHLVRRYVE